jgi:hypothetical protein
MIGSKAIGDPVRGVPALLLLACLLGPAHAAPACRAASDAMMHPLIELYTSEGCDSCPPADRWLSSRFGTSSGTGAIALAFHVDYWDRLGWVDRFADAAFTVRQQQAMRANGASFVYTPQVLLQGRDFAGWRDGSAAAAIGAASRKPAGATLALEADARDREVVVHAEARVSDAALARDAQLFIAYTDSGLASDVKAGENRGVRLTHDHVVRALRLAGAPAAGGALRTTLTMSRPGEAGTHPTLVAFVQRVSTGDVLQTLALPLDTCAAR